MKMIATIPSKIKIGEQLDTSLGILSLSNGCPASLVIRCLRASLPLVLGSTLMAVAATASDADPTTPETLTSPVVCQAPSQATCNELYSQRSSMVIASEASALMPATTLSDKKEVFWEAVWPIPEDQNLLISDRTINLKLPTSFSGTEIDLVFSEVFSSDTASLNLLSASSFEKVQLANAEINATSEQIDPIAQETVSTAKIPWQFSLEPYLFLPFGVNGDITVRGAEVPIDAGIGDIFDVVVNDLNFAAFGRFEAWKGSWGILLDGTYFNVGSSQTEVINIPPTLQGQLPAQVTIEADVGTSYTKIDLAGAYRFGDRKLPEAQATAKTEFDLSPFVFDAIAGLRLYFFNNDLVLTDDLGGRLEFNQSRTIPEPMIGGRARWNLSPKLAVLAGASMSGFGIGDLTFSVDGQAGIDWLFSGNTSLLASYRLAYVNYDREDSGLDLLTHGPTLGVKFRF